MQITIHPMRKPIYVLFPLLLLVTVSIYSVSIPQKEDYKTNFGYKWEQYNSDYFLKFQTVDDILKSADLQFHDRDKNTLEYFQFIDDIIRKRFYHGYSYYNWDENPIAYLAGKIFWADLSAIVIPDDILKHPMAACSQQSIVMMEALKQRNIPYRMVGFKHHYALEAFIENEWRFFDANMEAKYKGQPASVADSKSHDTFYAMYRHVDDMGNLKPAPMIL